MHEGLVTIADKGSVITWDFDVMRNDVVFTVYRLANPLPMGPTTAAGSFAAAATEVKSAKSPPPNSKVRNLTVELTQPLGYILPFVPAEGDQSGRGKAFV